MTRCCYTVSIVFFIRLECSVLCLSSYSVIYKNDLSFSHFAASLMRNRLLCSPFPLWSRLRIILQNISLNGRDVPQVWPQLALSSRRLICAQPWTTANIPEICCLSALHRIDRLSRWLFFFFFPSCVSTFCQHLPTDLLWYLSISVSIHPGEQRWHVLIFSANCTDKIKEALFGVIDWLSKLLLQRQTLAQSYFISTPRRSGGGKTSYTLSKVRFTLKRINFCRLTD